ncbi:MAG: PRC-barrel domain-containing protein [Thermoplasmata archaeon]|nr:PRC-barrel domain-containing protein [Thermoplasmata archaeon]
MKKFVTELRGKTAMTDDGVILGTIDNFVIDTDTGKIEHVLIIPAEDLETRNFKKDAQGRLIMPFQSMRSVRDVVVMTLKK